ncbi:MAG: hypothetical protein NTY01_16460 [Verrucomicrobia bacterium]|nr:hypothetical protein [Verrucomicrobiota bacterium]
MMTPMISQQTFDADTQRPPAVIASQLSHRLQGELLDNAGLQSGAQWTPDFVLTMQPSASPRSRLDWFKQHRFTPADKDERVARSMRALAQPVSIKLSVEQWREVAESADAEDQF